MIVVLRPPYQFDAATPGQRIAFSQFFGQHGYLPNLVDLAHNVNMHGTFIAAGPGIRKQGPVAGVRAIDLAPTLSFLMGFPGPQNARGNILTNLLPSPGQYKRATILDISDYHGQLVPLRGGRQRHRHGARQPHVPDRRLGLPEAVVRRLPGEADGGSLTVAAATRSARPRRSPRSSATRRRSS